MKKNLALLAVTVALLTVLAEVALQYVSPPTLFPQIDFAGPRSDTFGWIPFPNRRYAHVDPDTLRMSYFTTNSQGWKDVEHEIDKPDGVVRILFLGDSVTWGFVEPEDLYTRKVERLFRERGHPNVEVISMGVYAWGTDQELEALEAFGLRYSPDVVVYQFTGNDVINNILPNESTRPTALSSRKRFRYELKEGSLTRIRLDPPAAASPTADRRLKDVLLRSALIYNLNIVRHKFLTGPPSNRVARAPFFYDPLSGYFLYSPDEESAKVRAAWDLLEALLLRMKLVSEQNGAEFVVFAVSGESGSRSWSLSVKRFETDGASDFVTVGGKRYPFDFSRPLKDLTEICRRRNIPLIRPARSYERYRKDPHPNAVGNERMAQDVFEFLLGWEPLRRRLAETG